MNLNKAVLQAKFSCCLQIEAHKNVCETGGHQPTGQYLQVQVLA